MASNEQPKATVEIKYADHTYTGTVHLVSDLARYLENEGREFRIGAVEIISAPSVMKTAAFKTDLFRVLDKYVRAIGAKTTDVMLAPRRNNACESCGSTETHKYRAGGETVRKCRACGYQEHMQG